MEALEQLKNISTDTTPKQLQEAEEALATYVSHLIEKDFHLLLHLLYRADVPEEKLKEALQKEPATDAAITISRLLIKRQQAKAAARQAFDTNNAVDDEERW